MEILYLHYTTEDKFVWIRQCAETDFNLQLGGICICEAAGLAACQHYPRNHLQNSLSFQPILITDAMGITDQSTFGHLVTISLSRKVASAT